MTKMNIISQIKNWLQAIRIYSLTASIIPVLIGAGCAHFQNQPSYWFLLPLILICSVFYQAGTNLINDYYDYKNGVDSDCSFGSSMVIQQKLISPKMVLLAGFGFMIAGSALGLIFIYYRGWIIFLIGLVGFLSGIFYTAGPKGYKYLAIGDIAVFILMGPLMVGGSYFVLTGSYGWNVFWISLPIGFLVMAILWANNLRDITHDSKAGIKTLAIILGWKKTLAIYLIIIYTPFVILTALWLLNRFDWTIMLAILALPIAVKCSILAAKYDSDKPEIILGLVEKTAALHLVFGALLVIGLLI